MWSKSVCRTFLTKQLTAPTVSICLTLNCKKDKGDGIKKTRTFVKALFKFYLQLYFSSLEEKEKASTYVQEIV